MLSIMRTALSTPSLLLLSFIAARLVMSEDVSGPKTFNVLYTFEDSIETGGVQLIFNLAGPETITGDVELPEFNTVYDIDASLRRIRMTLVNNSIATDLLMPEGRADRYYYSFPKTVAFAEVVKSNLNTLVASTTILEPGFSLDAGDGTGTLETPIVFPKGGFLVTIGTGANFTELGQILTINYALGKTDTPPCEIDSFVLWNADNDRRVGLLEDQIDLCQLGNSSYTIQAATAPCAKKVKFTLFDEENDSIITKFTDASLPFLLGGEVGSDFLPIAALSEVGRYKIWAKTIPGSEPVTRKFEVVADCE